MERREAVKLISFIMGSAMVGGSAIIQGCRTSSPSTGLFSKDQIAFLDEVAEVIIPRTDTPGAKDAEMGAFLALMVEDTYSDRDQEVFVAGIKDINDRSMEAYGLSFLDSSPDQRHDILSSLNELQEKHHKEKDAGEPEHYFRMMKELTLLGFFTSEVGVKEVRRYTPVAGKFEPCIDYKPGDRAWVY